MEQLEKNKEVVKRFNRELIENGNAEVASELFDEKFVNHSAPPNFDNGAKGMIMTFNGLLRPAFPDLKVTILLQVAEGDLVTTHKKISGTHKGELMGIAATGKKVEIEVIDIVRIKDGKYFEHWGVNTLPAVLQQLAAK